MSPCGAMNERDIEDDPEVNGSVKNEAGSDSSGKNEMVDAQSPPEKRKD